MNPKPNQVNFSFFTWSLPLFSLSQCSFSKGWDQTIFKWYILCPSGVTWWFQLHHLYSLYSSTGIDHVVTQWTLHSFVSTCPRVFQLLSHYLPSGVHNIELPPEFPHFFVHRLFPRYKEKKWENITKGNICPRPKKAKTKRCSRYGISYWHRDFSPWIVGVSSSEQFSLLQLPDRFYYFWTY